MSGDDALATHTARVTLIGRPGGLGLLFGSAGLWLLLASTTVSLTAASAPRWVVLLLALVVWMLPPVAACIVLLNARMRVRVGDAGVSLREWGRETFVSYREITDVTVDAKRITLRLQAGKVRYLELVSIYNSTADPRDLDFSRALTDAWNRSRNPRPYG